MTSHLDFLDAVLPNADEHPGMFLCFVTKDPRTGDLTFAEWQKWSSDGGHRRYLEKFIELRTNDDLYFSPVLYSEERRSGDDAGAISQVVYSDADEVTPESLRLTPTVVVESSPRRFHTYLRLDKAVSAAEAADLSTALGKAHGMEASAGIRTKLLRVPGSVNTKREVPVPVRLVEPIRDTTAYTVETVRTAYPDAGAHTSALPANYSGGVADWFETLAPGEPSAAVKTFVSNVLALTDIDHATLIAKQTGLARFGAEGEPGVKWAHDQFRAHYLSGWPTYASAFDAGFAGAVAKAGVPATPTASTRTGGVWSAITRGNELDAKTFSELSWQVEGVLPEGYGLLTGASKVGKSWLAMDLALAVACGGKALGHLPTGPARPVLYFALEDSERRFQDRSRHLLGDAPIPSNLALVTEARREEVLPFIDEWLDVHGADKTLIVVDLLAKIMPAQVKGENAYERDYRIGTELHDLAVKHPGATILVLHHTRKASSEDFMDSTSGTSGINGAADFTLNINRARAAKDGVLMLTGRDIEHDEPLALDFAGAWTVSGGSLESARRTMDEVAVKVGLGDFAASIVDDLTANPGSSPADIAVRLGSDNKTVGTKCAELVTSGRLVKEGRGKYRVAN